MTTKSENDGKRSSIKSTFGLKPNDRRSSRLLPKFMQKAFIDQAFGQLYNTYTNKHKQNNVFYFIWANILISIHTIVCCVYNNSIMVAIPYSCAFGALVILLLLCYSRKLKDDHWNYIASAAWVLSYIEAIGWLFLSALISHFRSVIWLNLTTFLTFICLPFRLRTCVFLQLISLCIFIVVGFLVSGDNLILEVMQSSILIFGSGILGLVANLGSDKQQRQSFLDTRKSLEARLAIEEQSRQQERLLLSVLPQHVAVRMRNDLGSAKDSQFKKIYMSRHENVSILYADIVGFTAISSTYPASELVRILNELFGRFDKLAQRYHQLRLKILGDCYYCISGAPDERSDHAVLSVRMGLSMVKSIKFVRESTGSPVDMRVGIHTGAVLAGVLGQRQWQFDVYSRDVELANKMESTGLPGRVHVSNKTLKFLNDKFKVEPAFGEEKEEILRSAGLKTYFIVKESDKNSDGEKRPNDCFHLLPIPRSSGDSSSDENGSDIITSSKTSPLTTAALWGAHYSGKSSFNLISDGKEYKRLLLEQLTTRDANRYLSEKSSWLTLKFKSPQQEIEYNHQKEISTSIITLACPGTVMTLLVAETMKVSLQRLALDVAGVGIFFILIAVTVLVNAENYPQVDSVQDEYTLMAEHFACNVVSSVLAMVCTILLPSFRHFVKGFLLLTVILIEVIQYFYETQLKSFRSPLSWMMYSLLLVVGSILFSLARQFEKTARALFLWQAEAASEREQAADLRRRNQALLCNLLPPHVATHFLKEQRKSPTPTKTPDTTIISPEIRRPMETWDLYSQSYSEVGVLFASMPNFSDFYSEESINNQGLECLRFLNEVISDFDALLDMVEYQRDITKIKTIGSSYMAASGLDLTGVTKVNLDTKELRWSHLATLVDFGFEMQKALKSINEQSFNNFMLRIGINHGPVTAGVIGASKPHYDIWGNTVNVASRMESTGKAGFIQVTEETTQILQRFGFIFEQRGLVKIKGKGQLMTYYLIGKNSS
ncbi:adenylate cyclase type 3-like isoform X2 [Artemia franciscana]|uniref:adenylate cyclase type 3-like isoform X2 n=1 Tax=Artemia franciscana TaxID=6661 RepID=UPI0032DA61E5